jgi:hypothetical protein
LHGVFIETHSSDKEECDRWSWFYTHGFQSREKSVSELFWIDLPGSKWDFRQFERFDLQEVFLSKTSSTLKFIKCARYCSLYIGGLHCRDICLSLTQLNRPIWSKQRSSTPENYDLTEIFLTKTKSLLSLKQGARYFISDRPGFVSRDACASST